MSLFGEMPFQSVSDDMDAWDSLDDTTKELYAEALELVQQGSNTARLKQIFQDHASLDINKNLVPCYGETLLYQAVQNQKVEMVKTLLELDASPTAENAMDGETPMQYLEMMDGEDYDDRNETQEAILKLLLETNGPNHKPIEADLGQQIWDAYKEKLWAINVDPADVDNIQERNDLFSTVYLQDVSARLQESQAQYTPDQLDFCASRNKLQHQAKQVHEELGETKSALVKEAYRLLEMPYDEKLKVESGDVLVERFHEIYATPGVSVTVPSPTGETLLMQTVSNYILAEKYPDAQLELVRFLLENGADPNEEDCTGSTAQDDLDYEVDYSDLTRQQKEIVQLLKEAGALIQVHDDSGAAVGKRGEATSRHEQAQIQAQQH